MADSVRLIDSTLRDGSHAMAHQFTSEHGAQHRPRARRGRRRHDRDLARRRPRRVVVQLRLLEGAGVRPDQGRGRDRDEVEAGGAAAARHRHARGPLQVERVRREHGAHRHALHRGRRLGAAHRPDERAGHGGGRLPDDGAHDFAPGAAVPGAPHGELRRRLRLRHGLGRRADAGRLPRTRAHAA